MRRRKPQRVAVHPSKGESDRLATIMRNNIAKLNRCYLKLRPDLKEAERDGIIDDEYLWDLEDAILEAVESAEDWYRR